MKFQFDKVLCDCTKFGTKIPKNEYLPSGRYPIIDQGQKQIAGYYNSDEGLFSDVPAIIFGDHTRIVKYVDQPCFLGADGVKLLCPVQRDSNCKYLFYQLQNAAIPNTGYNRHYKWVKELYFTIPDKSEQERVVNTLDKTTDLISLRKQQIAKLDELVKSQFIEMFGDPRNNKKSFEIKALKEVSLGNLSYGSTESAVEYNGETRYVRITDITDEGTLNSDVKSAANTDDKYLLSEGDILFARTGATVGKTFRYQAKYGRCIYAGFLIRVVPDKSKVLPEYVFHFTKTDYYNDFVSSTQRVVAQPNINAQEYGELQICIPPLELQDQFAAFVRQSNKSKFGIQKSLNKLETLKKALMQQYFG